MLMRTQLEHVVGEVLEIFHTNFPTVIGTVLILPVSGTYLDGTLNWIASCSSTGSELICSFDLESDQFRSLALLPTGHQSIHHKTTFGQNCRRNTTRGFGRWDGARPSC